MIRRNLQTMPDDAWSAFKERLRDRWENLSDEEIDRYKGRFNSLAWAIHQRCNESRESAQNYIDNLWFEIYVRNSRWKRSFSSLHRERL